MKLKTSYQTNLKTGCLKGGIGDLSDFPLFLRFIFIGAFSFILRRAGLRFWCWPDSWQDPASSGFANRWPQQIWHPQPCQGLQHTFPSQAQTTGRQYVLTFWQNSCQHCNRHIPTGTGVVLVQLGFTFVFLRPPHHACPTAFLPHNCTADALASTGALFWRDHLGIFRFCNLRAPPCDWLRRPHDNLGWKRQLCAFARRFSGGKLGRQFAAWGDQYTFR